MSVPALTTERLLLRAWTPVDRAPFAALNADPSVTQYLPHPLTRSESDALVDRIEAHFAQHGYGLWAVECAGAFLGFVGVNHVSFAAAFTPAVELGWRLARDAWGHGYATEAGRAVIQYAFRELGLAELVSFTVPENRGSRAVMKRLGLRRNPAEDFDHPRLPEGHPLRRHVLYRLRRAEILSRKR